jgi:hypothetical protein
MMKRLMEQITAWPFGHPNEGRLLSLQDGTISGKRQARIRAHIQRCPRCRARAEKIAEEWTHVSALHLAADFNPAFSEEELVKKVRASIHAWSAASLPALSPQAMQAFAQTEAGRQVAAVLGAYLGQRAASALLRTGEPSPISEQANLADAGSTLRILLGRKSAAAVEEKLLRIAGRIPKSIG